MPRRNSAIALISLGILAVLTFGLPASAQSQEFRKSWIYALDSEVPPHLNAGSAAYPEAVSMDVDVTVTVGKRKFPRSVVVSYGPECGTTGYVDPELCSSAVYLYVADPKTGIKRFRTTIAVTAGNAPVLVSFRSEKNGLTRKTQVNPGTPRTFALPIAWLGTEVYLYPAGTPLGGSSVTIGSPKFLK